MKENDRAAALAAAAPRLTEAEHWAMNGLFTHYLFRRRKDREIWTTCCGRHEVLPTGTLSPALAAVMEARHEPEPKPFSSACYCHAGYIGHVPEQNRPSQDIHCPYCGAKVKVKELGRCGKRDNLAQYKRAVVFRQYRGALWARAYYMSKQYGAEEDLAELPGYDLKTVYRFKPGEAKFASRDLWAWYKTDRWFGPYVQDGPPERAKWNIGEPFPQNSDYGMGYDLLGVEEIGRSAFQYCQFEAYGKVGTCHMKFLTACAVYPRQVEMLMKSGFAGAVKDLAEREKWNAAAFDWNQPDPLQAFGLTKPELRDFIAGRYPLDVLVAYKKMKRAGGPATFQALGVLWDQTEGAKRYQRIIARLKKYKIKPDKLLRYVEKLAGTPRGRKKHGASKRTLTTEWIDYLEAAELLQPGATGDIFLFPRDLKQKHDEATKAAVAARAAVGDEKYKKSRLPGLVKRYTFSLDHWLIRPPVSAKEIIAEGEALKHCVGTYADRHIKGGTTILFLRDRTRPGVPLVTLEMDGAELVQAHGWDNDRTSCKQNPKKIAPRKLYAEVLDTWLAWVAAGSKRDKHGRPKLPKRNKKECAA